jgi:hypothetical protein
MVEHRRGECRPDTAGNDRGQAAVLLVAMVAALVVVSTSALAEMGTRSLERTRAQSAADAAALASLDGGPAAAADLAAKYGGVVLGWTSSGSTVTVTVRIGEASATSRASDER